MIHATGDGWKDAWPAVSEDHHGDHLNPLVTEIALSEALDRFINTIEELKIDAGLSVEDAELFDALVPKHLAIAVWSPPLNEQGSSHAGTIALEKFAAKTGFSVF